ncbi:MAG: histidine phosphotransferase family protein [Acetobacteraceae bacterium]|nr:histidine phosphotransferase family protein [Acetobacteraceae bacterium]
MTDDHNQIPPSGPDYAVRLAHMLAARLCHDLAGAVGSLGGALELAAQDPDSTQEALGVAQEASQALHDRLRLLRVAFGPAEQAVTRAELHPLLAALPRPRRVQIDLVLPADNVALPGPVSSLLLCLGMLGVECLAGEGTMALQQSGEKEFVLHLAGPRAAWPAGFAAHLATPVSALENAADQGPRGVLGPLVVLMAHSSGMKLRLLLGPQADFIPPLLISFD